MQRSCSSCAKCKYLPLLLFSLLPLAPSFPYQYPSSLLKLSLLEFFCSPCFFLPPITSPCSKLSLPLQNIISCYFCFSIGVQCSFLPLVSFFPHEDNFLNARNAVTLCSSQNASNQTAYLHLNCFLLLVAINLVINLVVNFIICDFYLLILVLRLIMSSWVLYSLEWFHDFITFL